jgi:hypothetical protein
MTTFFPICEGCFMAEGCDIQKYKNYKDCPCTTCLVKVTCITVEQICSIYNDFFRSLKRENLMK